ncbi:MAG: thioredoxin family protein [Propionibacteriaceae bacterium]
MNPRTLLATAPLALALLIAGCSSSAAMPGSSDGMSKAPTAMASDGMSKAPTAMATSAMSSAMMSAHGSYVTLADYTASMATYADTKVVYFFHASWCPDCKAADTALTSDPGSIPAKVTIVKVDYDTSTALKQKYGVTMQHTYVQVDSTGAKVTLWAGKALDAVLADLKG